MWHLARRCRVKSFQAACAWLLRIINPESSFWLFCPIWHSHDAGNKTVMFLLNIFLHIEHLGPSYQKFSHSFFYSRLFDPDIDLKNWFLWPISIRIHGVIIVMLLYSNFIQVNWVISYFDEKNWSGCFAWACVRFPSKAKLIQSLAFSSVRVLMSKTTPFLRF